MIAVDRWTGAHAQALRYALRMSVRAYAAYLASPCGPSRNGNGSARTPTRAVSRRRSSMSR